MPERNPRLCLLMAFGLNDDDVLKALEQEFQVQFGDSSRDMPEPHHIRYKRGWRPHLNPIQKKAVESPAIFKLMYGERGSGKTWGGIHELVDYAYRNDNTLGYIIVKETGIGSEGGAWTKLIYKVLPEWQQGIGLEFTEPKYDMQTKKPYVWMSNRHGGWSQIMMASLPVAHQVETKIRGREPQIILVDEAQFLDGDVYFTALIQQLGRQTSPDGDPSKIIFCCNPEGPSHWLYNRFFITPTMKKNPDTGLMEETDEWDDRYAHFHIPISDNKANLPHNYYEDYVLPAVENDPIAEARLVRGEWVDRPEGDTLFGTYFSDQIHMRGDALHEEGLLPVVGHPIIVSYDLGAAHASITFCQIIPLADGRRYKLIIDELDRVGKYTPYSILVPEIIERMVYWESKMKSEFRWDHISDDSAFTVFRPNTGSFDHQDVERISGEYVEKRGYAHRFIIRMKPAPKGDDSVEARVRMFTDDLISNSLLISATCYRAKEMIMRLPQDKDNRMKPRKKHRYVHNFDSATYGFFYYHARRTQVPGLVGEVETQSSYYTVG